MNFATLDLNLLRVVDAVLHEGSTVKAGERLGMSQSAVSGALGRARLGLGDPLFIRHGNRLVATDYARAIALPLREELDRLQAILAPRADFDPAVAEGTYRITASDFFAELLMPPLADMLRREAPRLRAQLMDLVPSNYVDSLERYNADLALIPDGDFPDWIERAPLFRSSFAVIARRGNPELASCPPGGAAALPLDLFCALGHVLFSPEGQLRAMGDAALEQAGRRRQVVMTLPVFSGVCRAVSESDLIALVPRQLAERLAPQLGLRLFPPPMEIAAPLIVGIWHRRATGNPLHAWLRDRIFGLLKPLNAGEAPV